VKLPQFISRGPPDDEQHGVAVCACLDRVGQRVGRGRVAVAHLENDGQRRVYWLPGTLQLGVAALEAARGLAAQVLADQIRKLRLSRRVGWIQLGTAAAYAAYGIFVLATGHGDPVGAFLVLNAGIFGAGAVFNAVLTPRRIRRNAEQVLRIAGPESP
jgi:hypothetical protein